jgi:hypothetical protein
MSDCIFKCHIAVLMWSYTYLFVFYKCVIFFPEMGKFTLKSNGNDVLSDESLLKKVTAMKR